MKVDGSNVFAVCLPYAIEGILIEMKDGGRDEGKRNFNQLILAILRTFDEVVH